MPTNWGSRNFVSGSTQYLTVGSSVLSAATPCSVSCWFFPADQTTASDIVNITDDTAGNVNAVRLISVPATPTVQWGLRNASATPSSSATKLTVAWHHLGGSIDSSGSQFQNLYIDGALAAGPTSTPGSTTGLARSNVGEYHSSTNNVNPTNGQIAEVAWWNVVLTASEFSALAKGARAYTIRPKSLVAYWPCDGLQSPEPDLSSFAHNLTLTNAPTAAFGPPLVPFTPRWHQAKAFFPTDGNWGSRSCDGVSTALSNTSSAALTNYPFTFAGWVYPTSSAGSASWPLIESNNAATANYALIGWLSGTGKARCNTNQTGVSAISADSTTTDTTLNTWKHIAGTGSVSGANATLTAYLNGGGKNSSTAATPAITSVINISIGILLQSGANAFSTATNYADIAAWNVVLSDSEIAALAKGARPNTIRPKSLVFYCPLDGLQSPEEDLSGAATLHNMNLIGSPPPAFGPPYMPFTPRWPQANNAIIPVGFKPQFAIGKNIVIEGVAT